MKSIRHFEFEEIKGFTFGYAPIGKPFLFVNIFFVDGLLIDTGQSTMRLDVLKTVKNLKVNQLFITHHHEDHSGNIQPIKSYFNCPVYASDLCAEMMKNPPPLSFAQKIVWGSRPSFHELTPVSKSIKTVNHEFQLISIPGHALDMVALYEPKKKWLFSADLYINSYIGYFLKNESVLQQINSIKKILDLDFKVLICSHNPPISNGKEALNRKLSYLEDFYDNVSFEYKKGYSAREIFKNLGLKEHGLTHLVSHGELSKLNMVRSVIRDLDD